MIKRVLLVGSFLALGVLWACQPRKPAKTYTPPTPTPLPSPTPTPTPTPTPSVGPLGFPTLFPLPSGLPSLPFPLPTLAPPPPGSTGGIGM